MNKEINVYIDNEILDELDAMGIQTEQEVVKGLESLPEFDEVDIVLNSGKTKKILKERL